jgi:hypothetical protein
MGKNKRRQRKPFGFLKHVSIRRRFVTAHELAFDYAKLYYGHRSSLDS